MSENAHNLVSAHPQASVVPEVVVEQHSTTQTLTGAVNYDAGLIREDAQFQMQGTNALAEKPVAVLGGVAAATAPAAAEPIADDVNVPANIIEIRPYITLGYGNPYLIGLRDELKAIELPYGGGVETFNLYSPFRKLNPAKNIADGLLRRIFGKILTLMNSYQGREVVYLPGPGQSVAAIANGYAQTLVREITARFPLPVDTPLLELETADGSNVILKFGDLFSVKAWATVTEEDLASTRTTISMNIVVNAGALYDSTEPHKFVLQALNFMRGMIEKLDLNSLANPFLCVAVNAESLQDAETREFIEMLMTLDNNGEPVHFSLATRASAMRGAEEWIPANVVDSMFIDNTDLLFFTAVFPEELDDDSEEEAADDSADDENE